MQKWNFLEYQFWANFVQEIRYAEFNCDVSFFGFGPEITFLEKFSLKIQNCLKWNLVLRLIWICRIYWMHWMHAEYAYCWLLLILCIYTLLILVWKYPFWLREHQQETFVTYSGFWPLKGWGKGRCSESAKKVKFLTKFFFHVILNEVLKNCGKWYLLI